jgi:Mo-dependent nitrogenase C-terminus
MDYLLSHKYDSHKYSRISLLDSARQWFDSIEIRNLEQATWLCRWIPASCPFARTISVFGRSLVTIPPMCKLNPFYEQLMALRFRALSYLCEH